MEEDVEAYRDNEMWILWGVEEVNAMGAVNEKQSEKKAMTF